MSDIKFVNYKFRIHLPDTTSGNYLNYPTSASSALPIYSARMPSSISENDVEHFLGEPNVNAEDISIPSPKVDSIEST